MRVLPKNYDIKKFITHASGIGFPDEGPAEWPDDSFTHRRMMDGDITNEEPSQSRKASPPETKAKG